MADCHALAPSGPCCALSNALAWSIVARGFIPPAAAMVVMLVVVGRWRLRGAILCGAMFAACLRSKNCRAHDLGLGKKSHPKNPKV